MTSQVNQTNTQDCPVQGLLKMLSGKFKPEVFKLATQGPLRFNTLLRTIPGANKQTLAVALKELEHEGLLVKKVITPKPLHIEYELSERGKTLISVFKQLEQL